MCIPDISAHTNALRSVHPAEKLAFSALALGGALAGRTAFLPLGIFALCCGLLLAGARVGPGTLLRFIAGPLLFLAAGLPAILISWNPPAADSAALFSVPGLPLGITRQALGTAARLTARVLGSTGAFGFLTLTTPIFAMDQALSRLRIPPVLRAIGVMMYRYIFITLGVSESVRMSQRARGGYRGFLRSLRSLGTHSAAVMLKTYGFARISHGALMLRGFDGTFDLVPLDFRASPRNRILLVLFGLALAGVRMAEGM